MDVYRFALVDKVRAAGLPKVHLHNIIQSNTAVEQYDTDIKVYSLHFIAVLFKTQSAGQVPD